MAKGSVHARGRKMEQAAQTGTPKSKLKMSVKPEEGSVVEVRSAEEGYKEVWYIATVLHMENQHKVYVEYCSLVSDEDSSEPLREYVDVDFIRPLPPRDKFAAEPFELGHVVDAYFQDGWWTGVITGVVFRGMSFVVTFQDQAGQQHVFGSAKLRFHRPWVNGKWEKPGKRDHQEFLFSAGKKVEVCRDRFIPATIVEERGNGLYLVHYDGESETVDSSVIRPCPPSLKDHVFHLGDKVDAFLYSAWWCGTITQLVPDSCFIVLVESINNEKQFSHSDLRLHLHWNQGNWDVADSAKPTSYPHSNSLKTPLSDQSLGGDTSSGGSLRQTYRRKRKEVHEEDVLIANLKIGAEETASGADAQGNDDNVQPMMSTGTAIEIQGEEGLGYGAVQGHTDPPQEKIKRGRGRPRKISLTSPSGSSAKIAIVEKLMTSENKDEEIPTQEAVVNAEQSDVASMQIEKSTQIDALPFVKANTILWSTVESMEPFQKWPQKPHFRGLQQYDASSREGKAIGLMVTFCSFVERSSKLEFLSEAKSSINELLGALVELEDNGFDVKVVRDRIAMREKRGKLLEEYEEINGEIAKQNKEIVELDAQMEELKKQMKKVQEEVEEAMSKKEMKSREIASLQLKLEGLRQGMM